MSDDVKAAIADALTGVPLLGKRQVFPSEAYKVAKVAFDAVVEAGMVPAVEAVELREDVAALEERLRRLLAENERLREEFECESCEHNMFHHDGTRYDECDGDPYFGEFCTFLVCGRCSNERTVRTRRYREALECTDQVLARIIAPCPQCHTLDRDADCSTLVHHLPDVLDWLGPTIQDIREARPKARTALEGDR